MARKRLQKSLSQRKVAGVCGGIAEYLNVDPTFIRLLWGLWMLAYGTGLPFYLLAWWVIPAPKEDES